jgi:hypothetical protein
MTLSLTTTNTVAAEFVAWTAENPAAARLILLAVPLAVAVATAILSHHPVLFMPPSGGGGGCGAPC